MSIGGGFGLAQEMSVDFRHDNEISLVKGTRERNWERVLKRDRAYQGRRLTCP